MFSSVRSFLSRHRRKFFVTGIVIGGAYLASRYIRRILKQEEENTMKEWLTRTWKQKHYDSIERASNQTILSLSASMNEKISSLNDTEALITLLKSGAGKREATFEKLKIVAFSKLTLFTYLSSLLVVTMRLEINLIGGYMYTNPSKTKLNISEALREKYLSHCQILFSDGVERLNELIREKVELVLSGRSLKESIKLQDFEQILYAIHTSISDDSRNPCKMLTNYALPTDKNVTLPDDQQEFYQKLLAETRELFESDEVISMVSSCIKRGFSFFVDNISEFFIDRSHGLAAPDSFFAANIRDEVHFKSIPLAKILPYVTRLIRNGDDEKSVLSAWIKQLILMDDLKVLGANVYECFCE